MLLVEGGPPERGGGRGATLLQDVILLLLHSYGCTTQAVNKMLNLIDFKHLQTVLLFVVYARIKTFPSIAGRYHDDKIMNVKTPKFCRTFARKTIWFA